MQSQTEENRMRIRDEIKEKAVIDATIKVVNEIGFASASISKIAKEAGVSAATIYIYHKNKEDLMVNTYYEVKQEIITAYFKGVDEKEETKEKLFVVWCNILHTGKEIADLLQFANQFANSPFYDLLDSEKLQAFTQSTLDLLQQGIENKQLKMLTMEEFNAFFTIPAIFLSNQKICGGFADEKTNIERTFQLAWSTIKQ